MGRARVGVRRAPAAAAPGARVAEGRPFHRHKNTVAETERAARVTVAVGQATRPALNEMVDTLVAATEEPETEVATLPTAVARRGKARHVADEEAAYGGTGRAAFGVTATARVGRALGYFCEFLESFCTHCCGCGVGRSYSFSRWRANRTNGVCGSHGGRVSSTRRSRRNAPISLTR